MELGLEAGREVGRYRIEAPIGEGGVAHVFHATFVGDGSGDGAGIPESVALKVLKRELVKNPHVLASFQYEMRVLARLDHRGIMRVYETDDEKGLVYAAVELIKGIGLDHHLAMRERLTEATTIDLGAQVADALGYLHGHGYVHRDVKPANLMLCGERVVLSDFGTVIRAVDGVAYETGLYGTPAFLAPEQILRGEDPIDGRSDLYALGVVLYLMITGQKPFYGSRDEVLDAHVREEPAPPASLVRMSPDLDALIRKALAKRPADRFQTGEELAAALRSVEPLPPAPSLVRRVADWIGLGRTG